LAKLGQEADELARIAQTIPPDVASIQKGKLPKDMIEKLKQIEKLSKRLRSQINP
jgi:flagellar motor component MotA